MEMSIPVFFAEFYAQVFRILQLQLPYFGVSIWQFWCGAFVITLSIRLIHRWLSDETYESVTGRYPRKG